MKTEKQIKQKLKEYENCSHAMCSMAEGFQEEAIAKVLRWVSDLEEEDFE